MSKSSCLLEVSGNYSLVQLNERRFPAIAIQMDSFRNLLDSTTRMKRLLDAGEFDELKDEIEYLSDDLDAAVRFAEAACSLHGVSLPYESAEDSKGEDRDTHN